MIGDSFRDSLLLLKMCVVFADMNLTGSFSFCSLKNCSFWIVMILENSASWANFYFFRYFGFLYIERFLCFESAYRIPGCFFLRSCFDPKMLFLMYWTSVLELIRLILSEERELRACTISTSIEIFTFVPRSGSESSSRSPLKY